MSFLYKKFSYLKFKCPSYIYTRSNIIIRTHTKFVLYIYMYFTVSAFYTFLYTLTRPLVFFLLN